MDLGLGLGRFGPKHGPREKLFWVGMDPKTKFGGNPVTQMDLYGVLEVFGRARFPPNPPRT